MYIRKATQEDKIEISKIRPKVYQKMLESGLNQWDDEYPSDTILFEDIDRGEMLAGLIDGKIVGYVTVNEDIPDEYKDVTLKFAPKICVHRLSVNPEFVGQGVATKIMQFVHEHYKDRGYASICLDTCEANIAALGLYNKLGYIQRGYVKFKRRPQYKFPVMEISLI